jgi:hypothetical protein
MPGTVIVSAKSVTHTSMCFDARDKLSPMQSPQA